MVIVVKVSHAKVNRVIFCLTLSYVVLYKYVPNKVFPWVKDGESERNFQNIFFIGSKQQYLKPNTAV